MNVLHTVNLILSSIALVFTIVCLASTSESKGTVQSLYWGKFELDDWQDPDTGLFYNGLSSEWFYGVSAVHVEFEPNIYNSIDDTITYKQCFSATDYQFCNDCDEFSETATALTVMTFVFALFELVVSSVVLCCVTPSVITGGCGILFCLLGFVFGITAPSMWYSRCMQEVTDALEDSIIGWNSSTGAPPILLFVSGGLLLVCGIIECVDICQLHGACGQNIQPQMQLQMQPNDVPARTVVNATATFDPNTGAPLPVAKFDPNTGAPLPAANEI